MSIIKKHRGALLKLVGAILVLLVAGGLFNPVSKQVLAQDTRDSVLIRAIPFVLVFVAIILTFILVITLVALQLNGRINQRVHRPIELIIIAGILVGVVGLFQPWKIFAYEYGFLTLLISTLSFILWSHVIPKSARSKDPIPPLTRRAHLVGIVAGVAMWIVFGIILGLSAQPKEPYGLRPTVWEMSDPEEQQQIADDAESEYQNATLPVLILLSTLPGGIFYFAVREVVALSSPPPAATQTAHQPPAFNAAA